MSIVNTLDRITEWTQSHVCDPVTFKVPPVRDKTEESRQEKRTGKAVERKFTETSEKPELNDGAGYEYERATPVAFTWLVPSSDRLPPEVKSPFPSACVRFGEGSDDRTSGEIPIEICFSVWNPGTHGSDIIYPVGDGSYSQWSGACAKAFFERDYDGWREVWNWIDLALREIESAESLNGIMIDKGSIKFGPFKQESEIVDFYPFWFAYISFTVKRSIVRNVPQYEDFL